VLLPVQSSQFHGRRLIVHHRRCWRFVAVRTRRQECSQNMFSLYWEQTYLSHTGNIHMWIFPGFVRTGKGARRANYGRPAGKRSLSLCR
jgi:hypothetical protein